MERAMPVDKEPVRRDAPTGDRVAALDTLRVVPTATVVALYASVSDMAVRIPGLIWPVNEPAGPEFLQQFTMVVLRRRLARGERKYTTSRKTTGSIASAWSNHSG